ncbi:MAG: DUF4292 domain-containing protein [Bacteroidota bacterium]
MVKIGIKKSVLLLLVVLMAISCKSTKRLTASGEPNEKLSTRQLIKTHKKNFTDFNTLQAKVKIDITQGEKSQGATFNLRMEKDKVIWLSATLGLARLKITPEKVQYYSKLDNEYFDGDYLLISDFAGVDLDFNKVQNLLLGHAIYDLDSPPHVASINDDSYILKPKEADSLLDILYLINPGHFKLDALELYQPSNRRMLQVDYESYQKIKGQVLPKDIRIVAVDQTDQASIEIDFKSINLDNELRFPFKIPSGFKEIQVK